jgi:hypothetical protein
LPADNPSPRHCSERCEGTATFEGDLGPIAVTKSQGRWSFTAKPAAQARYNLIGSFDNWRTFRDALSGYILSERKLLPKKT